MKTTEPIEELELVLAETAGLSPRDEDRAALIATLRPIAETMPRHIEAARIMAVNSQHDAEFAAQARDVILGEYNTAVDAINEFDNGLIARLFQAHRKWTAFRGMFAPLEAAAKTIKGKVINYQEGVIRAAKAEEARLQAEADERARRERERLEKQAAALKTPELREQRMEQAAAVVAPVVRVAAPVAAVKVQRRWAVRSIDKAAFLAAAASNPQLQGFVTIDETKLTRAKAANEMFVAPGIEFEKITV